VLGLIPINRTSLPLYIEYVILMNLHEYMGLVNENGVPDRHQIQSYIETRIDEQRKTFDPQNIRNLLDLYLEQEGHTDAKMSGTPFSFTNPIYYLCCKNIDCITKNLLDKYRDC
jgi:hypothetical protein